MSQDLPLAIVIIDTAEATQRFLSQIADLLGAGLVVVDDVWVHSPGGGPLDGTAGDAAAGHDPARGSTA